MPIVYLGLGSNLCDRKKNIKHAIDYLIENGVSIQKISSIIETNPLGGPPQDKFLNAVIEARTQLSPEDLLSLAKNIEKRLGREETERNGPRTIDIDILLYGKAKINTESLTIPHPRIFERDFVTIPLKEIAPDILTELDSEFVSTS